MNKKIAFMLLILAIILSLDYALAETYSIPITGKAKAFKAADGDTIYVSIPVRLIGIDCFEIHKNSRALWQSENENISVEEIIQKGLQQKNWVQKQLNKNNFSVEYSFLGKDKYGRQLGEIYFFPFKKSFNAEILQKGICKPYLERK